MTVAEIKAELGSLGADTSGNKAVLVERLEAARAQPSRPQTAMSTADVPPSPEAEQSAPAAFAPAGYEPDEAADGDASSSVIVTEGEINFEPKDKIEKRRSSVGAHELAIPVLQARLRAVLGATAKLPKKKPDLLALYLKECDAA